MDPKSRIKGKWSPGSGFWILDPQILSPPVGLPSGIWILDFHAIRSLLTSLELTLDATLHQVRCCPFCRHSGFWILDLRQSHTRSRYGPSTGAPGGGPGGDRGLGAGQSAGTDRDRGPGPQPQAGAEDRGPSHRLGSTRTESQGLPHPHCC